MASSSSSSAPNTDEKKIINLVSSDNVQFEVEENVISESKTIKHMIDMFEDGYTQEQIPVSNVTGATLAKVIEYCRKHVEYAEFTDEKKKEELKKWDAEFVDVDQITLFNMMLAANYLEVKSLLDHCCQTVADIVKYMPAGEIKEYFNVTCDFTEEELAELKRKEKQSSWNEMEAS